MQMNADKVVFRVLCGFHPDAKLKKHGSAWGPVTLPVFKTGES